MPIVVPLLALDVIVVALWCIALALTITLIMNKLSAILNGVPWVGGKLSDAVQSMSRAITNAAGTLMGGIDAAIGAAWHALARYIDKWLNEFVAHSAVLLHLARLIGGHIYTVSGLRSTVRGIAYVSHAALVLADKLAREYKGIEHRVKVIERELGHGIGNDVRTRVNELEHGLGRIERKVIPGLRHGIAAAEGELTDLERWLGITFPARFADWASALVLTAISALGYGFLRCSAWRGLGSRLTCGIGQLLLDLLEGAIAVMVVEDICAITKLAIGVLESPEVSDFLTSVEDGMQDLFTCQGADVAPALAGPYYSPPPVQPPAALAA